MRNGRGVMPNYNRIEEADRWDVVNYVRALQGRTTLGRHDAARACPGRTAPRFPGPSQTAPTMPAPYVHPTVVPTPRVAEHQLGHLKGRQADGATSKEKHE